MEKNPKVLNGGDLVRQFIKNFLAIIADPDYGDISDVMTGRDIVVERQTAAEAGNQYGKTTIRVKPNQTALVEDGEI